MQCPNCSYKLVLLPHRAKYKCSLCSNLYPQKLIENEEFQKYNKLQRHQDITNLNIKRKQELKQIRAIKNALRYLFNGEPKSYTKEYIRKKSKKWRLKNLEYDDDVKQEYRKKNKELINLKARMRRKRNPEEYRKEERKYRKEYRSKNLQMMKVYERIRYYRRKQKMLTLLYLKNEQYKASSDDIFHSVPTFVLAELLFIHKTFYIETFI